MKNINALKSQNKHPTHVISPWLNSTEIDFGFALNVQPKNDITVVSLFSGCGGMDLGFLGGFSFLGQKYDRLPFNIVWANEINEKACNTYKHR